MPIERETMIERPAVTETVVARPSSSPFAIIGIIIAVVLAVLLVMWLASGGITSNGESISVDLPNVTVTQ